jgi:hypothetical protein
MERFFARKLEARAVSEEEASAFISLHHRAGTATSPHKTKAVGLYQASRLLALAQFTTPRTEAKARRYTTELLRMVFEADVRVVGGASKLIAYYKATQHPTDIFTYQDATGEVTAVYEQCGFTFVGQAKTKPYLVAPGKTLATATRREALGLAYATRYGPDRILGTSLGARARAIRGSLWKSLGGILKKPLEIESTNGSLHR